MNSVKSNSMKKLIVKTLLVSLLSSGSMARAGGGDEAPRNGLINFIFASLMVLSPNLQNALNYINGAYFFGHAARDLPSDLTNALPLLESGALEDLFLNTYLYSQHVQAQANDGAFGISNDLEEEEEPIILDFILGLPLVFGDGVVMAGDFQLSIRDFVPLFFQAHATFLGEDDSFFSDRTFEQVRMILEHMVLSKKLISFDTFLDACREIYYRLAMISRFSTLTSMTSYNTIDNHSFVLGSLWRSTPAFFKEGKKWISNYPNIAFKPTHPKLAFKAICSCYKQRQILDCSGAVITHMYGSLALALGEDGFNQLILSNPELMIVSPMNAQFKFSQQRDGKKITGRQEHPILYFNIVEEVEIDSLSEIVPGDVVYFVNHPSYEDIYPQGAYSGEYCVYLGIGESGEPIFAGLGMSPRSYKEAVNMLKRAYSVDTQNIFPGSDSDDDVEGIIGDSYPSLDTAIFSMRSFRSDGVLSSEKLKEETKKEELKNKAPPKKSARQTYKK